MTKSRNIQAPRHRWTPEQEQIMRDRYPYVAAKELAAQLGTTLSQVYRQAQKMSLQKSEAFQMSDRSGRMQRGKQSPAIMATQFKPGSKPWNTGRHYIPGGRSAETRFKAGRPPQDAHNYLPIGSLRITKDGYLERKVNDDQSLVPARRWIFVHRLVWEAQRGPIPHDYVIAFKKGMATNEEGMITVDRLECISRAENAHRNSLWRSDPEMMRLHQLKAQISRQVNRIKKAQNG